MSSLLQQIKSLDINKQNTLTAGENISILDNVISSTGGGSTTDTTKVDVFFLAYHNANNKSWCNPKFALKYFKIQ